MLAPCALRLAQLSVPHALSHTISVILHAARHALQGMATPQLMFASSVIRNAQYVIWLPITAALAQPQAQILHILVQLLIRTIQLVLIHAHLHTLETNLRILAIFAIQDAQHAWTLPLTALIALWATSGQGGCATAHAQVATLKKMGQTARGAFLSVQCALEFTISAPLAFHQGLLLLTYIIQAQSMDHVSDYALMPFIPYLILTFASLAIVHAPHALAILHLVQNVP